MNKHHKTAISYLVTTMIRSPNWRTWLNEPETLLRWAGFNEWFGSNVTTRFYFNDPEAPNEKMFGYREGREWKWNGWYEGTKKKLFKELNARNRAKMLSAYETAKSEMMAYIENHKNELCCNCFDEKLVPWLRSQGAEPRIVEWDF